MKNKIFAEAISALKLASECGGEGDLHLYQAAYFNLVQLGARISAHSDMLDAKELPPTGEDFNEIMEMVSSPEDSQLHLQSQRSVLYPFILQLVEDSKELQGMKTEINGDYSQQDMVDWNRRIGVSEEVLGFIRNGSVLTAEVVKAAALIYDTSQIGHVQTEAPTDRPRG